MKMLKFIFNYIWFDIKNKIIPNKKEIVMDKKMAKVTTQMKTAESDIKKGKPVEAVKALKGAEKKNEKLTKIDKEVRDPIIRKYKAEMKKK